MVFPGIAGDLLPVRRSISMATACQWRARSPSNRRSPRHASQYASLPYSFKSLVASRTAGSSRAGCCSPRPACRIDRASSDNMSLSTLSTRADIDQPVMLTTNEFQQIAAIDFCQADAGNWQPLG